MSFHASPGATDDQELQVDTRPDAQACSVKHLHWRKRFGQVEFLGFFPFSQSSGERRSSNPYRSSGWCGQSFALWPKAFAFDVGRTHFYRSLDWKWVQV